MEFLRGIGPYQRITYGDLGLWDDLTEAALARVIRAARIHSGMPIGIQLSHAGRKASGGFGKGDPIAPDDVRGWRTVAPSALPLVEGGPMPEVLDLAGIDRIVAAFGDAAARAAAMGLNLIELHGAHGFLIHQFLSPITNRRTDDYGGNLENRMRLSLRVFDAVKAAVPASVAVGIRISATDWVEGGWDLDDSIALAKALDARDCTYIHVSAGGLDPERQQLPQLVPGYQLPFAEAIRQRVKMPVVGVGLITEPRQAEEALATGKADLIALGRGMLYNPRWPWHAAVELGASVTAPWQYHAAAPRASKALFTQTG
ncbi:tRNA-dihydrouridine synthase [Shinella sp. S4-D37]|uniref:oxidoreductase n=1 Tax=Shinella sp. S4-D37 TaxID=3161999 RepID=UPI0034672878